MEDPKESIATPVPGPSGTRAKITKLNRNDSTSSDLSTSSSCSSDMDYRPKYRRRHCCLKKGVDKNCHVIFYINYPTI